MRIVVAAIGRARRDPAAALFDHYRARLDKRFFAPVELKEMEERRPLPAADRIAREGMLLRAAVPKDAVVVALDARGEPLTSTEFAGKIGAWRDAGRGAIAFLIGGADGLDKKVTAQAELVLSLGPMTWPHLLVRGMLAEQLYRAQAILAGHPYHRD